MNSRGNEGKKELSPLSWKSGGDGNKARRNTVFFTLGETGKGGGRGRANGPEGVLIR